MQDIKFAIFGDCGSHGIVDDRKHTRAIGFNNWYSVIQNPIKDEAIDKCVEKIEMSPYNIRNLQLDLKKGALDYLLEEKGDYLLIDPNDCRMELGISGKQNVYTISNAGGGLYKQICDIEEWKKIPASDIPLDEYISAAKMICGRIKEVYKPSEIILHVHKIVDEYTDGRMIGRMNNEKYPARKKSVQELMDKMYDILRQELEGCHVIEFPDYVLADSRHRFGLCGLHYHELYYEYGKAAIQIIIENHPDEKILLRYLRDMYSLKFHLLRDGIENRCRFSMMESRIDNLLKAYTNDRVNLKLLFSKITDAKVYFEAVNLYKHDIGVFIAVRDTPGFVRATNSLKDIKLLGIEKYPNKLWYTYCGFVLRGVAVADVASDTAETPTAWEGISYNHIIHLESHSYRKKNESNIIIDGVDYSYNGRGANIVIVDAETFEVIDSVVYDSHDIQDYFRRK